MPVDLLVYTELLFYKVIVNFFSKLSRKPNPDPL